MAGYYTVKQGDHLSSIAKALGFSDYQTIWNDGNNAALKQQRQNPNVLFPGDQLYIPDREPRVEPRPTEVRHKFVKHGPTLKLQLVLEDQYEKPIANAECELTLDGNVLQVVTDATGKIVHPITPDTKDAMLVIKDPQTPFSYIQIPIKIGYIDPVDQVSGQAARLNNLGYDAGDGSDDDADQFQSALEEFQCDQGLTVDGKCGPATQAKLKQVHGS
jgi:hypothetical protein